MVSVPLPGNLKSVARYWSPKAWRPMMIGLVQPGTSRGPFLQMIGSREEEPRPGVRGGGVGGAADDDRLGPAGYQPRHVLADDRLAEDDAAQDVADGAVGRAVHLLEIEL